MSTEENKALVRRFEEELNKGNLALIDELFAADCVIHLGGGAELRGPEEFRQLITTFAPAFPDFVSTIEDLIAEGDKVVCRFTRTGTHKGEWLGIAATGKHITWTAIEISRIVGGKVVEAWGEIDMLSVMQQLGAIPTPGQ